MIGLVLGLFFVTLVGAGIYRFLGHRRSAIEDAVDRIEPNVLDIGPRQRTLRTTLRDVRWINRCCRIAIYLTAVDAESGDPRGESVTKIDDTDTLRKILATANEVRLVDVEDVAETVSNGNEPKAGLIVEIQSIDPGRIHDVTNRAVSRLWTKYRSDIVIRS
jgi:hypothetical protein